MNAAIVTARAGSESIPGKNVMEVADDPLVAYPVRAARAADRVDEVYVSTNGDRIAEVAREHGAEVIRRPERLAGDGGHGEVIRHATRVADDRMGDLDHVALLLGNTTMLDGDLIDLTLETAAGPDADSAMTVWAAEDDHPARAMAVDGEGYLRPHEAQPGGAGSSDRKTYAPVYFYDQGPWAFEKGTVESRDGPTPWWWLGTRCRPIRRTWTTGRDVHTHFDALLHEWYERNRAALRELEHREPYPFDGDEADE